nr:MAG: hypothetical protein DIU60_04775 [Actinomycetota bacterium]
MTARRGSEVPGARGRARTPGTSRGDRQTGHRPSEHPVAGLRAKSRRRPRGRAAPGRRSTGGRTAWAAAPRR